MRQYQAAEQGHTDRGVSGTLYLKSAIAGIMHNIRALYVGTAPFSFVLRNGSRAIAIREPCQVGNQAALSGEAMCREDACFERKKRLTLMCCVRILCVWSYSAA